MIINNPSIESSLTENFHSDLISVPNNHSVTKSPKSFKKRNILICISSLSIMLLIGSILLGLFYTRENKVTDVSVTSEIKTNVQFVEHKDLSSVINIQAQMVVLTDSHKVSASDISVQKFPHLKSLVINSPYLVSLQLDSKLRLDSLVINNSKLVSFSYNSTELKSLILIDNKNMTEFINSNLPFLENITIIRTNIQKWQNLKFGRVNAFRIQQCSTSSLPQYQADSVLSFEAINCSNSKSISTNYFSQKPIRRVLFENHLIKTLDFSDSSTIHEFKVINGSATVISLKNFQSLDQISLHSQNVQTLRLYNSLKLDQINISLPSLITLDLITINIDSLQNFGLQNLQNLRARNLTLRSFNDLKLPKIKIIQIDYSFLNESTFDLASLTLYDLTLINYRSNQPLDSNKIPNLTFLSYTKSNINKVNVSQFTYLRHLYLSYLTSPQDLQLTLNDNIQLLKLLDLNISQFSNYTLNNLTELLIAHTNIWFIEYNDLPNLLSFNLYHNYQLKRISANNFSSVQFIEMSTHPDVIINQTFPVAQSLYFRQNNISSLRYLSDYFPNLYYLGIYYDSYVETISNLNLPNLILLEFQGNNGSVSLLNNTLPNLQQLNMVQDVDQIKNNILINIQQIYLRRAQSLDLNGLIEEFKSYALLKAQPRLIYLPETATLEIAYEIKQIFPKARVVIS